MAQLGTGTTITMSGFTANIISVDGPSMSRESVQTSHMATTNYHTFIPASLVDGGELTLEVEHESTTAVPITNSPTTVTIVWGGTAGTSWSFTGFMTGYTPNAAIDERMTASVTVKVAGEITIDSIPT